MNPGVSKLNPHAASYVPLSKRDHNTQNKQLEKAYSDPEGLYGSSSQDPDEYNESDILEFLQMSFPGMSDESLNDVYLANKCDLEATIDMLNQLEMDAQESPETLPDNLDIGVTTECSSAKLKNVRGEAGPHLPVQNQPLSPDGVEKLPGEYLTGNLNT